tara:strand:+ start:992 stop:1408 length:417 start_codon:yes stop_codon:yes gene_type:complete
MQKMCKLKECSKCKESFNIDTDFYNAKAKKDGKDHYCKTCRNAIAASQRIEHITGSYFVYALPNENGVSDKGYCGQTKNLNHRIRNHKYVGKVVDGWKILKTFKTRVEALAYELEMHTKEGYAGNSIATRNFNKLNQI